MSTEYNQCNACGHVRKIHTDNCSVETCSCPVFIEPPQGEQTCPRRQGRFLAGEERRENPDYWSSSHWGPHYEAEWPEGFERPRTCSYCGGVNPEDAVRLISQGWELEGTTKGYRHYLHPPGFQAYQDKILEAAREGGIEAMEEVKKPGHIDPKPPVKLYVMHFNPDQIRSINEEIHRRLHSEGLVN